MFLCVWVCVGLSVSVVYGYRTGAPTRSCGDMTPGHGSPINTDPAPFLVEVSKTQYSPNERIYVRIRGCGMARFKGFMIQPRSAVYPDRPAFLGAFLRVRGTRYECVRTGAVLTHSSSDEKQSVTLTWIAPPGPAGHVVFRVTFVQSYTNYWVGINSPVVYDGTSRDLTMMQAFSLQSATDQSCLPTRRAETTTSAPPTTTSTAAPTTRRRTTTILPPRRILQTTTAFPATQGFKGFFETTTLSPTTTTRRTTTTTTTRRPTTITTRRTTTTRRPTTRRPTTTTTRRPTTTTTTTTTLPPTTTRNPITTTVTTLAPPRTTGFYDYYWEGVSETSSTQSTTTKAATTPRITTTRIMTTTTTPRPTTTTTIMTTPTTRPTTTTTMRTTTTTLPPTTTTEDFYIPTTTTVLPPETTTTTTLPPTTSTTLPPTTTTTLPPTTTTTLPPPTTTTEAATTTTTAVPTTSTSTVRPTTRPTTTTTEQITTTTLPETTQVQTERPTTTTMFVPTTVYVWETTTSVPEITTRLVPSTEKRTTVPRTTTTARQYRTTTQYLVPTVAFAQEQTTRVEAIPQSTSRFVENITQAVIRPDMQGIKEMEAYLYNIEATTRRPQVPTTRSAILSQTEYPYLQRERYPTDIPIQGQETRAQYPATERASRFYPTFPPTQPYPSFTQTERTHTFPEVHQTADRTRYPDGQLVISNQGVAQQSADRTNYPENKPISDQTIHQTADRTHYPDNKLVISDQTIHQTSDITHYPENKAVLSDQTVHRTADRTPNPEGQLVISGHVSHQSVDRTHYPEENLVLSDTAARTTSDRTLYPDERLILSDRIPDSRFVTYPPELYLPKQPNVTQDILMYLTTFPPTMQPTNPQHTNIRKPTTTTRRPMLRLTPDPKCGVTHGCFDDCVGGRCTFIVSWTPEGDNTKFEIRTKPLADGSHWAAIGFSDDKMMGLDSVTECLTDGQKVEVFQSYNLDYYRNMRLLTPKLGILEESGGTTDGLFRCSFTRANFAAGEKDVFDLNKDWYIMFAEGRAVNGIKIPHRYDRVPPVSAGRVDLQRYPPVHETYDHSAAWRERSKVVEAVAQPTLGEKLKRIPMDGECGSRKSCFQDCTADGCRFIVSWLNSRDHVTFDMRAVLNGVANQWIAIAFSEDNKMGDDSVIQCVAKEDGTVGVEHSFNDGKNNVRVKQPEVGLSNTSAGFIDGVFKCSFSRQRFVLDDAKVFDLDKDWTILFAHGKSKKGIMLPHTLEERPHVSDNAVDFSRAVPSLITAPTLFIKVHACLMIFAWILCASVASVIGRYFQPYWWGEKMFGSKLWVKVNWLFVLLTTATVIGAFAVIFVGVDGISQLYENPVASFTGAHPIMGLVVALLALLNPLLLCLRPSEDSSGRAFFNCLYWIVEIGAHVLAVVTIYAGFGLASFLIPSFFTFLLIGFTVYQILVLLFMEALKSYDAKKTIDRKKQFLYEMQVRPWTARKNNSLAAYMDLNHRSKALKQTVLAAHLILLSALTTTMVVLIVINDQK